MSNRQHYEYVIVKDDDPSGGDKVLALMAKGAWIVNAWPSGHAMHFLMLWEDSND